jgi:ribonuclease BN (tRNA processing enzyme)
MFITHLHAVHLADYYNFFMLEGWGPSGDGGDVPIVAPQDPTPGLHALTERPLHGRAAVKGRFA